MAGLRFYALEPGLDRGVSGQIEAAFVGDVGVRVERDVGDRVAPADEPFARLQMRVHYGERVVATPAHQIEDLPAIVLHLRIHHEETDARDIWLVAVLLKEQPLQYLGALETICGEERRAVCEVGDDRVGLEEQLAIIEFDGGDSTVGKFGEEFWRPCFTGDDVEFDALEGDRELGQEQADFVAVAGGEVVVEDESFFLRSPEMLRVECSKDSARNY